MKLSAFDAASRVIGYCTLDYETEHLLGGGLIRGKSKSSYLARIDTMLHDVANVLLEEKPDIMLVEMPLEKQHMPKKKLSGAPVWAVAAGEVAGVCRNYSLDNHASFYRVSNLWTKKSTKPLRQMICARRFPDQYDPLTDPGADVSDAIMMSLKWIKERKLAKAMLDRGAVKRSK